MLIYKITNSNILINFQSIPFVTAISSTNPTIPTHLSIVCMSAFSLLIHFKITFPPTNETKYCIQKSKIKLHKHIVLML